MKTLYADTYYYIALLSVRDSAHKPAMQLAKSHTGLTVTSAWVLSEIADGLCAVSVRQGTATFVNSLRHDDRTIIVPPTVALFDRGLTLFSERPDKNWSLTDCISFLIMEDYNITEALTGDRHFQQAGFVTLL